MYRKMSWSAVIQVCLVVFIGCIIAVTSRVDAPDAVKLNQIQQSLDQTIDRVNANSVKIEHLNQQLAVISK
jgi:hypothetical protein